MGQEFFINSQQLEDKIRQLLPSQGGAGAGLDLSATTQIVPVVDLTESAEGSNLRADLQTALSFSSITFTNIGNTTTDLITNTGYFRVFGGFNLNGSGDVVFKVTDGASTKNILKLGSSASTLNNPIYDFIVFLKAGDTLQGESSAVGTTINVCTRQLADIDGNLVNP
jgi:hypothetical protein